VKPNKKLLLIALVILLVAVVTLCMMPERDSTPGRLVVHCAGLITNSTGVYNSYVISNQSPYTIKVTYYFEGFDRYSVWNGSPIPKTIIEAGRATTVLRRISKQPDLEFHVHYLNYTAKARLYDFVTTLRLNKVLPAAWGTFEVLDEHCPLCAR
jgi:hypothetical protein